jgi:hypothetical protein
MRNASRIGAGVLALMAIACGPLAPNGSKPLAEGSEADLASGAMEKVTGGGQFVHPDFGTVTFSFVAVRHADGRVTGRFQQHQPFFGFTYKGDVTCFAVDPVNHRAWIGGVLTQSNDPDPITGVGDDAWFRILDLGNQAAEPDRSTFLGFEGAAGITTSEEYCRVKLWAPDNARTWPVARGNIVIH